MNTSTRIKQFLKMNQTATVQQLSSALDLTRADIHYHLRLLVDQGAVGISPVLYQNGAGRPARQFHLLKPAPDSLARLTINILINIQNEDKREDSKDGKLAEEIANGILNHCCDSTIVSKSPAVQLTRIIKNLSDHGIHLRWQASKNGPHIYVEQEYLSNLILEPSLVADILTTLLDLIKKKITGTY